LVVADQFTFVPLGLVTETDCDDAVVVPASWLKESEVGLTTSDGVLGVTVSDTVTVDGLDAAVGEVNVNVPL